MSETHLQKYIKNLTSAPGVYCMKNAEDKVIYVGKARNLKKRVSSYFNKNVSSPKTKSLVTQIASIEVRVTSSETEALILESSLIKSLHPKYNVLLRDDKSYPYIMVSISHDYPRISSVRLKKKPNKGIYFGPFPNANAVRETIDLLQKIFKIRNCTDVYFSGRARPCLQYQIKRCSAPCTGYISKEDYNDSIKQALMFLSGKSQKLIDELTVQMDKTVNDLAFEKAAILRDQIKNLRVIQERQEVSSIRGEADVIAIAIHANVACVQFVSVRGGEILSSNVFYPKLPKLEEEDNLWEQVFQAFIAYYYLDYPERIPDKIITEAKLQDKDILEKSLSELRGKKCKLITNPRAENKGWYQFAYNNLQHALSRLHESTSLIKERYIELANFLKLEKEIKRMECFDISHTQGAHTVASCVVFAESGPNKKAYRRFNIKGITPGDDYAAIEQAVLRRSKQWQEMQKWPDVVIIDGGKGQVNAANKALSSRDTPHIELLGIAKGAKRKVGMERIIFASTNQEVSLEASAKALHLLQHIRDESHRFAITAHRKQRAKKGISSSLEQIEGLGPKRRQALLKRFGGIRELARAPAAEIMKVKGISRQLAEKITGSF